MAATAGLAEETYIAQLARYIRANGQRLASTNSSSASSTWASTLLMTSNPLKPLTLTLSLYHLYYVLLKIQEAGFADVGDLDVQFKADQNRRPAVLGGRKTVDKSDSRSIGSRWTLASSLGSGWWGASTSSASDPEIVLEKNLKIIYTAFTLLPALRIVMRDPKGKHRAIEGFPFADYPGDRMLPLTAFKNLQRLEVQGIDARVLLFTQEWPNIRQIQVRDAGLEQMSDLLACPDGSNREWNSNLRVLDFEDNDITSVDASELVGLEHLHSLSLRRNLLISVPSALANLTTLRSLDLSENMIDSVLAIYKSLGALSVLNLRANRISSLCGIERLLSLAILDLRTNLIEDVSELTRLVTLPHLSELYVSDGNPFINGLAATDVKSSDNGWRIDLFNAFLKESNPAQRQWNKETLPSIDGYAPTWNEKRYLVEHYHGASAHHHQSGANDSYVINRIGKIGHEPHEVLRTDPKSHLTNPRKIRQASETSNHTAKTNSSLIAAGSRSPPLPSPLDSRNGTMPNAGESDRPKMIKRKHRRVVDLDGHWPASSTRRHERSVSSPDATNGLCISEERALNSTDREQGGVMQGQYHTITSHPSTTSKSRTASRNITNTNFVSPQSKLAKVSEAGKVLSDADMGSGSEVEEFRRKMEKLRDEVGVENWLSVYASASQTTTPSIESSQKQLHLDKKGNRSEQPQSVAQSPKIAKVENGL